MSAPYISILLKDKCSGKITILMIFTGIAPKIFATAQHRISFLTFRTGNARFIFAYKLQGQLSSMFFVVYAIMALLIEKQTRKVQKFVQVHFLLLH